jgi:hypothetical protein
MATHQQLWSGGREVHWREATILSALDGLQPAFQLALDDNINLEAVRRSAKEAVKPQVIDTLAFRELTQHGLGQAGLKLFDFVENWMISEAQRTRRTDEILSTFYLGPLKFQTMKRFLSDAFRTVDVTDDLHGMQDDAKDQAVASAVDVFETDLGAGLVSEWDASVYMAVLKVDPFVDVSYPLYRGYADRTRFENLKSLFRKRFSNNHEVNQLVAEFERSFGKLEFPEIWQGMVE